MHGMNIKLIVKVGTGWALMLFYISHNHQVCVVVNWKRTKTGTQKLAITENKDVTYGKKKKKQGVKYMESSKPLTKHSHYIRIKTTTT
jgi:hypothetical protein